MMSFPDGLQDLTEKEQLRVDSANASYEATAELILLLVGWGVSVSIENPANSLFWKTSWIARLLADYFQVDMTPYWITACTVEPGTRLHGFGLTIPYDRKRTC